MLYNSASTLSFACWSVCPVKCIYAANDILNLVMHLFHLICVPFRRQSAGAASDERGQEVAQQHGVQRQRVARRVQFAFQLDLGLIIKLAAMIFLFSQDGSPQNFVLLIFFASFVYL